MAVSVTARALRSPASGGAARERADQPLRIAVVAETFLPSVNGVSNSVVEVASRLRLRGHDVAIIAPAPGEDLVVGVPVIRVPSIQVPGYPEIRLGRPSRMIAAALRVLAPDIVHVAAPVVVGSHAIRAARRRDIPTVAVYQTDLPGFAKRYRLGASSAALWRWTLWVHAAADLTLAASTAALWELRQRGLYQVAKWARGVDVERFQPGRREDDLRGELGADVAVLVGFVGRLAKEKQIERLRPLLAVPRLRVVVVGDGPARPELERALPDAVFTGFRSGLDLARHYASLDVFVHTGVDEMFCQAVQEALASGVPAVVPAAGGPLDLVQHGVNGFLWNPLAPRTMVGAVQELANSPMLRERMSSAAEASVAARTWPVVVDELEGHYRATIGGLAFAYGAVAP